MDISNPLAGLEIGSCAFGLTGTFGPTVVKEAITKTNIQPQQWMSMQGQSDYVYTKQMNQASAGVAGSYGVSGVSELSTALSAYAGNATAQSGKSMTVDYQILVRGGLEYVNFDGLTPSQLLKALEEGPKSRIVKALDAYLSLNAALEKLTVPEPKLYAVLRDSKAYPAEYALFEAWLRAVESFKRSAGDGMVVAVAWGGIGLVRMEMSTGGGESVWKYGGEANFSYAGIGASASVGATYDGGRSRGDANVKVTCSSFSSGRCVESQTKEWFNTVSALSFKQLADVNVLDKAPEMATRAAAQKPPDFVEPKKEKGVADKIESIKSLKGLKAYAQAAAYDKAKKDNPKI